MLKRVLLVVLLLASSVSACIWDYDTLRDEQRGLPGVFEIITGRFEKRSEFFYRDRITKMRALLAREPNNQPAIDNLAVALFRVGEYDEAVKTLLDKEKRFPDQYTTASNLATFYMLHGDLASAVPLLEKALRINPNAHFGREKYQLELAKFLVSAKAESKFPTRDFLGNDPYAWEEPAATLPADDKLEPHPRFVNQNWRSAGEVSQDDAAALQGILGMIRFGTDQSPDLIYALGNLLLKKGDRQLATRAYRRAIELNHPRKADIVQLSGSVEQIIADALRPSEEQLLKERSEAKAWADGYMAFADNLIRQGKDADLESNYKEFYKTAGPQVPEPEFVLSEWFSKPENQIPTVIGIIIGVPTIIALVIGYIVIKRFRRKKLAA